MSTPKGVIYSIAERTGKLVDLTYSSLVHQLGLTPPFFKEGLGQLDVVDFHNDLVTLRDWLPTALDDPVSPSCASADVVRLAGSVVAHPKREGAALCTCAEFPHKP